MYKGLAEFGCLLNTKVLKYLFFVFVILLAFKCSNSQRNHSIIPLSKLNKTDSIEAGDTLFLGNNEFSNKQNKFILHRVEYFLVKGDTSKLETAVDKFVKRDKPIGFEKYDSYEMVFIKESREINERKVPESAEDLETTGFAVHKDFIYSYSWQKGVFKGKLKFENGKIIGVRKGAQ